MTCTAAKHGDASAYSFHQCRCPEAIRAHNHYKIKLRLDHLNGIRRIVPATATHRRMQALTCMGWTDTALAEQLGITRGAVYLLRCRTSVKRTTADRIASLYERLNNTYGGNARAVARAEQLGWLGPGWWDDDTIDDPTFDPLVEYADPPPLCREDQRAAERAEVQRLTDLGWSGRQIADHLGCSARRIVRLRREALQAAS